MLGPLSEAGQKLHREQVEKTLYEPPDAVLGASEATGPVLDLNLAVTGGLLPDVTFLLLLDPDVAIGRQAEPDRLEREGLELQSRVDGAYRELAERFPDRIVTIDATGDPEAIAREVRERLRDRS